MKDKRDAFVLREFSDFDKDKEWAVHNGMCTKLVWVDHPLPTKPSLDAQRKKQRTEGEEELRGRRRQTERETSGYAK